MRVNYTCVAGSRSRIEWRNHQLPMPTGATLPLLLLCSFPANSGEACRTRIKYSSAWCRIFLYTFIDFLPPRCLVKTPGLRKFDILMQWFDMTLKVTKNCYNFQVVLGLQKARFFEKMSAKYWNIATRQSCPITDDSQVRYYRLYKAGRFSRNLSCSQIQSPWLGDIVDCSGKGLVYRPVMRRPM
jgi:hypothetical protein